MNKEVWMREADELFPQVVAWRRHFHQHAELSFQEFATTDYIEAQLKELEDVEISRPTKTGLVARIRGGRPGRTIAIRADIDALPITECNELAFRSETPGVMHACGHDGHTAMLLGAAVLASRHREELCGELVCIFQHAEELPPGGAIELYEAGVMKGVDELYGCHLSSNYPTGKFGVRSGALTAATDRFDIAIRGKGGHSSMPELCVDPVVCGAQAITALQNIVSRNLRALEPAVVSVCQVSAGDAYNIIPQEMIITGSVRTFSEKVRMEIPRLMDRITAGICASAGAEYSLSYELGYASVVNDEALTASVEEALAGWFGPACIQHIEPVMPGEDFSALQKDCPACFVEIGTRNEAKGTDRPHHNPAYMMDEDGLRYGVGLLAAIVAYRMGGQ